ncbi:hypothetical protein QYF36_017660 [Acer negundo]|nr:hypothetical protein QYF36_017660 [Acer negundo]
MAEERVRCVKGSEGEEKRQRPPPFLPVEARGHHEKKASQPQKASHPYCGGHVPSWGLRASYVDNEEKCNNALNLDLAEGVDEDVTRYDDIASKTPIDDDKTNLEFVKRYKRYHLKVIRHNVKLMKLNSMLKHKLEMSNKEVETLSRFNGRLIRNASDQDLSLSEWIGRLKELKSLVEAKDEALRQVKERV